MKQVVAHLGLLFLVVLASACTQPVRKDPIYLVQNVSPRSCELMQIAVGAKPDRIRYEGKLREIDPQVYECAIEVPPAEFAETLGVCALRGHNIAAGYSFFSGDPKTRRHGCDVRPLGKGNVYFNATGINNDSCDWICFPQSAN